MLLQDEPDRRPPILRPGFPKIVAWLSAAIILVSLVQFYGPASIEHALFASAALIGGPGLGQINQPLGGFAPYVLHVFLHGGLFHLIMNMAALFSFGPIVAKAFGRGRLASIGFLAFFFACAIGGGLAQMAQFELSNADGIAIGASSAISGLLPAVGWLQRGWKGAMQFSIPWLIINVLLALSGGFVDLPIAWAAHVGGLAAGFAYPVFLALFRSR